MSKVMKTRIQLKADSVEAWDRASENDFKVLKREAIFYSDADRSVYPVPMKINLDLAGSDDGVAPNNLEFVCECATTKDIDQMRNKGVLNIVLESQYGSTSNGVKYFWNEPKTIKDIQNDGKNVSFNYSFDESYYCYNTQLDYLYGETYYLALREYWGSIVFKSIDNAKCQLISTITEKLGDDDYYEAIIWRIYKISSLPPKGNVLISLQYYE